MVDPNSVESGGSGSLISLVQDKLLGGAIRFIILGKRYSFIIIPKRGKLVSSKFSKVAFTFRKKSKRDVWLHDISVWFIS